MYLTSASALYFLHRSLTVLFCRYKQYVQGNVVEEDDFWCRYFYKLSTLHEDEQRLEQMPRQPGLGPGTKPPAISPEGKAAAASEIHAFLARGNEKELDPGALLETNRPGAAGGDFITPRTAQIADDQTHAFIQRMNEEARRQEELAMAQQMAQMAQGEQRDSTTEDDSDTDSLASPVHRGGGPPPPGPPARCSPPKLALNLGALSTPQPELTPTEIAEAIEKELGAGGRGSGLSGGP